MQKYKNPESSECPVEGCNHADSQNGGRLNHIKSAYPDFDPEMFHQLQMTVQTKVDGIMEVTNRELVLVESVSYTPLEAEIRRTQVTRGNFVPDELLSQAIQYF